MTDVFISYAREDRGFVDLLERALQAAGHRVWFDRHLNRGDFRDQIELELRRAGVVIVVWSARSVRSRYVVDEAEQAVSRGALLPVRIDDTPPSLGFRGLQTFDLSRWSGEPDDARFNIVLDEIARARGMPPLDRPAAAFLSRSLLAACGLAIPCALLLALADALKRNWSVGQALAASLPEALAFSVALLTPVMLWHGFDLRRLGLAHFGLILRRAGRTYAVSAIAALVITAMAVAAGVATGLSGRAALAQMAIVTIVGTLTFGAALTMARAAGFLLRKLRS